MRRNSTPPEFAHFSLVELLLESYSGLHVTRPVARQRLLRYTLAAQRAAVAAWFDLRWPEGSCE